MKSDAYGGMRVGIVGSCQINGLWLWAEKLLPGARVEGWHVGACAEWMPDRIVPQLPGCDLIVTQVADGTEGGLLDLARLREICPKVVFLPMVVFRGFQPDCVFRVGADGGGLLQGPMGVLHSAIVVAAHQLGIPAARVPRLFNALVLRSAGYHTVFPEARAALLKNFAAAGYDLAAAFEGWLREGAFMYTDNHPHLRVLETLARMMLEKAGLAMAEVAEPPPDNLANSLQWPVYPDIAKASGVAGSTVFLRSLGDVAPGESREMTLEDFVAASYRVYEQAAERRFQPDARIEEVVEVLEELVVSGEMPLA